MIAMKTEDKKEMSEPQNSQDAEEDQESVASELHAAVWSVVSFEKCLKNNLTYDEAALEMERLKKEKINKKRSTRTKNW